MVIDEMPFPNPQWGMYYAGVDTISPLMGTTSISLQSIHIYKAAHEIDGEFAEDKLVAWYTGRTDDPYGSYEISRKLIKFYNARALVENNNRNYIEWMIKENERTCLMRKSDVPISKELIYNSNVSGVEYGINVTRLKDYLISLAIEYISEVIGTRFNEKTGESTSIYGVTRIKDKMLLKEMLEYSSKKNTDRLDSFCLALLAAKSNTNRGVKVTARAMPKQIRRQPRNPFKNSRTLFR